MWPLRAALFAIRLELFEHSNTFIHHFILFIVFRFFSSTYTLEHSKSCGIIKQIKNTGFSCRRRIMDVKNKQTNKKMTVTVTSETQKHVLKYDQCLKRHCKGATHVEKGDFPSWIHNAAVAFTVQTRGGQLWYGTILAVQVWVPVPVKEHPVKSRQDLTGFFLWLWSKKILKLRQFF